MKPWSRPHFGWSFSCETAGLTRQSVYDNVLTREFDSSVISYKMKSSQKLSYSLGLFLILIVLSPYCAICDNDHKLKNFKHCRDNCNELRTFVLIMSLIGFIIMLFATMYEQNMIN